MPRINIHLLLIVFICLTFVSSIIPIANAIQIDLTGLVDNVQDGNTFTINQGSISIGLADIHVPGIFERGYDHARRSDNRMGMAFSTYCANGMKELFP